MSRPSRVGTVLDTVSGALFIVMFLVFLVEVFFRYVLDAPLSWSMELILVSFIVLLFWALTFSVPLKRHVSFTVVRDLVPPAVRRIFALLSNAACAAVLAAALPGIIGMAVYEVRESTPILHIPLALNYGFFALFVVAYGVRLAAWTVALVRPGWRDRV